MVGSHCWRRSEHYEHPDQSHLLPKATSGTLDWLDTNYNAGPPGTHSVGRSVRGDAAKNVAQALTVLSGITIMSGVCLVVYHHWRFAVAFVLAAVLFACGLSRAVTIGFMCVVLVVLAIIANAASAQTVVDGDPIRLNGTTYRIWAIDAAETRQRCADGWEAGREATKAMLELVRGRRVAGEAKDKDRYGRTVALCRADGQDVGAAMVRSGMTWAFTRYSSDYISQERSAIGARLGIHAHDCEKPWDWRRQSR